MERPIVFYFAWQEDQWLDELLDYFADVIALLPAPQSLAVAKTERLAEAGKTALLIVNPQGEPEKSRRFLDLLTVDETLAGDALYIVGVPEAEAAAWQAAYPAAEVVAMREPAFAFDFAQVLARMAGEEQA